MIGDVLLGLLLLCGLYFSAKHRRSNDVLLRNLDSEGKHIRKKIEEVRQGCYELDQAIMGAEHRKDVANLELERSRRALETAEGMLESAPKPNPLRIHVVDWHLIHPDHLWVVPFERSATARTNDAYAGDDWGSRRLFVLSASSTEEAVLRCPVQDAVNRGYAQGQPLPLGEVVRSLS